MNSNTILAFRSGTGRNQLAPLPTTGVAGDLATAAAGGRLYTNVVGTFAQAILAIPLQTAIVGSADILSNNANEAIKGPAYGRIFGTPRGTNAPYFSSASFDGVPFRLRVSGLATMGANGAQALTISLIHGPAVLIAGAGNTPIATAVAANAIAGGAMSFDLVAEILWESGIGILSGRYSSVITLLAGALTTVKSDVTLDANPAAATLALLQFQVFATAGNAAASLVQIREFALEQI
jgi:hypothetical protein